VYNAEAWLTRPKFPLNVSTAIGVGARLNTSWWELLKTKALIGIRTWEIFCGAPFLKRFSVAAVARQSFDVRIRGRKIPTTKSAITHLRFRGIRLDGLGEFLMS
jgi:hypothetical protein